MSETIVELGDLRDLSRPQKGRETLNLASDSEEFVCEVMCLALDYLALLCNVVVDLSIGSDEGIEFVAESPRGLFGLDINFTA